MRPAWQVVLFGASVLTIGTHAAAQGWLWPFEPSSAAIRGHHPGRRTTSYPRDADVPLPVPRPHFPQDQAKNIADQAKGVTDQKGVAVPAPSATRDAAPPHEAEPPTPPPASDHPAAAGAPDARATDASAPAPDRNGVPMPPPRPADLGGTAAAPAALPAAPPLNGGTSVAPGSGATTAFTPRQPGDDHTCIDRLLARKVEVERATIGPQPDSRCTVVEPVHLLALTLDDGGHVAFPDHPTIACTTADVFSAYVHDLMAPLVKGSYGATLLAVGTGPGLECRSRDSIFGAKLSAHGQGLAVDIAQLRLSNGRTIEVGTPKNNTDTAFETAARAGGCGYFHTVLGPGSDAYHRTHWHFDLLVRGKDGDSKYCK